jgi:Ca2+-binding RTX toxin-like protein
MAGEGDDVVYGNDGGDYLSGNAGNDSLDGGAGNDSLMGAGGNDFLDGGLGADTMSGGVGNDTYVVDDLGDVVTETSTLATEIDTVQSSITHTLGANLENLTLTSTAVIDGTGNELANVLRGNSVINTLSGLDGDDTIYAGDSDTAVGGSGNDTLVSENSVSWNYLWGEAGDDVLVGGSYSGFFAGGLGNDIITGGAGINFIWGDDQDAATGGGNDTITGGNGYDYVMAGEGDDVVYGNDGGDYLSGNQGNDTLYGGVGNDSLIGGLGIDMLVGGLGDDTYSVDNVADLVAENAGEGTDTVQTTITRILDANVENLILMGTTAIDGTGNELANVLTGNGMANVLDGGLGADTLVGGLGNDSYIIGRDYGADTVVENDTTTGNTDIAQFLSGVSTDQIWFQHVGNDLQASVIGATDTLVVKDWYLGTAYHIEQFKTADGKTLLDSQVENLVNAMASFAPPAAGQTTLPQNYQDALAGVIAANWQ